VGADDLGRIASASLERMLVASLRQRAALARLLGLLSSDVLALEHVLRAGELAPGALAARMPLSSAGTAAAINRLRSAGLLVREPDRVDRRRAVLRATDGVRTQLERARAPLADDIAAILRTLAPAERARTERVLAEVAARFEHHAERLIAEAADAARAAADVPPPVQWG
jgi:DNA-binding MarR family transcriptional regulator